MIITGKKFSKPTMSRVKNGDMVLPEKEQPKERVRLDHILIEKYPDYNRSTLQNFIKSGYVTIDGKTVKKPNYEILKDSEPEITLSIPEKDIPADVKSILIYEDDNVIVINKPSGLLSMAKGEFTTESTLEDYGLLVHRLDRDTSGVVILAKNEATQTMLRKQFQDRKAHKTYYAVVDGRLKLDEAIINLPIARNLKQPTTFMVDPKGKPAETYYKVIRSNGTHSLLELKPTTGRTHQLRVHLKYIGCPIVGDKVYNTESKGKRLMLHAYSLEISIPGENENVRRTFVADLPNSFKELD
ncbi:RluA family pseudouridine synthase [Candidatus Saccharibacteria bacterium]|nr:RluA family pseudouridine synthase [Candidatus Saccharibacteria bacterium]